MTLYFRNANAGIPSGLYAIFKEESRTLEKFGWMRGRRELPVNDSDPQQIRSRLASSGLFETLGVPPLMGRWPAVDDSPDVALLSYGFGPAATVPTPRSSARRSLPTAGHGPSWASCLGASTCPARPPPCSPLRRRGSCGPLPQSPTTTPRRVDRGGSGGFVLARLRPGVTTGVALEELSSMYQTFHEQWADAIA